MRRRRAARSSQHGALRVPQLVPADTAQVRPCSLALGVLPRDGPPRQLWHSEIFASRTERRSSPMPTGAGCAATTCTSPATTGGLHRIALLNRSEARTTFARASGASVPPFLLAPTRVYRRHSRSSLWSRVVACDTGATRCRDICAAAPASGLQSLLRRPSRGRTAECEHTRTCSRRVSEGRLWHPVDGAALTCESHGPSSRLRCRCRPSHPTHRTHDSRCTRPAHRA